MTFRRAENSLRMCYSRWKFQKYPAEKADYLDEWIREIYECQLDPEYVHNKFIDLEDRSRSNNLSINGIN